MFSHLYLISTSLVLLQLVSSIKGNIIKASSIFISPKKVPEIISTLIGNNLMKFEVDKSFERLLLVTGHSCCEPTRDL